MTFGLGAAEGDRYGEEESYTRRSRRRLYGVVAAVVVMTLSAGGLYLFYREGARRPGGEAPLIQADQRAVKTRPEQPGGMNIPNQDTMIYNPGRQAPAERLLAPPEEPMVRPVPPPAPPPRVEEEPSAPPAGAPAVVAAPAFPEPEAPSSMPVAAPVAPPAPAVVTPPPAVAAVAPAKPAPRPAAAPAAAGSYRLQIGALRTDAAARKEWGRLKHIHADLLGGLGSVTSRADLHERGTFYRIQAGPIPDAAKAARLCSELKRRNVGCILVKP
jgi:cell division septation protein DedD